MRCGAKRNAHGPRHIVVFPVDDARRIKSGIIRFDGQSVLDRPPYRVTARICIAGCLSAGKSSRLTVGTTCGFCISGSSGQIEKMVKRSISCSLSSRASLRARDQIAGYMSGGERQMLAIAQCILCEPKMLEAGRAIARFAPAFGAGTDGAPHRLRQEFGISILLIEQDALSALEIADYGYIMEGGRLFTRARPTSCGAIRTQGIYLVPATPVGSAIADAKQYRRTVGGGDERLLQVEMVSLRFGGIVALNEILSACAVCSSAGASSARTGPARQAFSTALQAPTDATDGRILFENSRHHPRAST